MPTIYLARHGSHAEVGHVLSGRSEIGLSALGRDEAHALARRLHSTGIEAIYASPRARTLDTAAIVAQHLGLSVQIDEALDEIDFGEWTGQPFDDLAGDARWHDWNAHRGTAQVPGGETMTMAVERIRWFIEGIAVERALCVTHCDMIRGLVAAYLGLGLDRMLTFDCDPASLTTLARQAHGTRIVTLNERTHQPA